MIRFLVNRLHVSTSYLDVARLIASKARGGRSKWRSIHKATRKKYLRQAFDCHRENRGMYAYVMGAMR